MNFTYFHDYTYNILCSCSGSLSGFSCFSVCVIYTHTHSNIFSPDTHAHTHIGHTYVWEYVSVYLIEHNWKVCDFIRLDAAHSHTHTFQMCRINY